MQPVVGVGELGHWGCLDQNHRSLGAFDSLHHLHEVLFTLLLIFETVPVVIWDLFDVFDFGFVVECSFGLEEVIGVVVVDFPIGSKSSEPEILLIVVQVFEEQGFIDFRNVSASLVKILDFLYAGLNRFGCERVLQFRNLGSQPLHEPNKRVSDLLISL